MAHAHVACCELQQCHPPLFRPQEYIDDHTGGDTPCDIRNGDFNADGAVNGQDIDGFVAALFGR